MDYTKWSKLKFWLVIAGVFIVGIVISAYQQKRFDVNQAEKVTTNNVVREMVVQTTTPTTIQASPTITNESLFLGTGQQATNKFILNEGLVVFKMTHTGNSNFIVKLLDNKGNYVELLANTIGSFDGSKAVQIKKSGQYLFNIEADGQWTVSVK